MPSRLAVIWIAACLLLPATGAAFDYDLGFSIDNLFVLQRNVVDPIAAVDTLDETYYALYLNAEANFEFNRQWNLFLEWNSGEIRLDQANPDGDDQVTFNGESFTDEWDGSDLFFRQLYVDFQAQNKNRLALRAGKVWVQSGKGFILDDFQWGVLGFVDLFPEQRDTFLGDAGLVLYEKDSLWGQLRMDYPFSAESGIGAFLTLFVDRGNHLASNIVPGVQPAGDPNFELRNKAELLWLGSEGRFQSGILTVEALAILQMGRGRFNFNVSDQGSGGGSFQVERTFDTLGYLFDVEAVMELAKGLSLSLFYFQSSGDRQLLQSANQEGTVRTFLPILPYNPRATLFFNSGGVQGHFSGRTPGGAGEQGKGLISPGAILALERERFAVETRLVLLWSEYAAIQGGLFYGTEMDIEGQIQVWKFLSLFAEVDWLYRGNFYDSSGLGDGFQFLAGLGLTF